MDMQELRDAGFFIIKKLISVDEAICCLKHVKDGVTESATQLNVSARDYINCTGRWVDPSPVTKAISNLLNDILQAKLETLLQCKIRYKRSNIICKTSDLIDAVPFHQDISYSPDAPYHFSVWLALNDVSKTSGALQIIKDSHKVEVETAVDFWSPYFIDKYLNISTNLRIITLPIAVGDAIVFDSRLMHGSGENLDAKDRFAYVSRWIIENEQFPIIPRPKPLIFGMLNCGLLTENILKKALLYFGNKTEAAEKSQEKLIEAWLSCLEQDIDFIEIDNNKARKDLYKLLILHRAADLHNAGDISGKIYKNLWFSLLNPLNKKVQVVKEV